MPAPPVLPCSAPTGLSGRFVNSGCIECIARIEWLAPADREPDSYTVTVKDLLNDYTYDVSGVAETAYEYELPFGMAVNLSFKVKAVYPECESDYAMTNEGTDYVTFVKASVDEQSLVDAKLYPNPTTGQLSIEAEGMTEVGVYDLLGQCLMQMSTNEGKATVDMSQLQNGIYIVKMNTVKGTAVRRVVKM